MRRVWIIAIPAAMVVMLVCAQCRRPEKPPPPPETDTPDPIQRVDTAELEKWLDDADEERNRWLRIERIKKGAEGGWITGELVEGNRIEIETRDVEQFVLDLSAIPIDWTRRAVLRIDDSTSQLTRKHHPIVRLRRTPSGGWSVVKE